MLTSCHCSSSSKYLCYYNTNLFIDNFLSFQSSTNLPGYLKELVADRARPQPFVLLLGERSSPSTGRAYVIVEGRAILSESLLKAVDSCFKVFYVLGLHYPKQCATTWEFIQKVVYEIGDQEGKSKMGTSPCVRNLRAFLNNK